MMNDELTRLRAELKSMGAPGDYGYGTDTGEALMLAHRIMAVCYTQTARAEAAEAALAASRAPDPVANAGSCQTGDTIRQLLERHEAEMRAKGRNPLDYTSKWKQAADVVASLPAAPVAEAKPIEDKILARAEDIEKEARNG